MWRQAVHVPGPERGILLFAQTSHQERVEVSEPIFVGERVSAGLVAVGRFAEEVGGTGVFRRLPLEELISHRSPGRHSEGIERALHPGPES